MDLLNDMVNNKEKLLQDLRNFTNKLYEKDNRIKNNSLGWEVIAKKLNKEEDNMKKSINDNIASSDDNMNLIISTLNSDKDKDKYINEEDIKYNIWHTLRCEKLEENFPKFVNDLQKNFRKEDWIQIIIELFPSISGYSESEYDWIENKRKENWED